MFPEKGCFLLGHSHKKIFFLEHLWLYTSHTLTHTTEPRGFKKNAETETLTTMEFSIVHSGSSRLTFWTLYFNKHGEQIASCYVTSEKTNH